MTINYIKMAVGNINRSRIRSVLTMLGVIIGVTSVVSIVSIGEGVKRQIVGQIQEFGNDRLTIRSGKTDPGDQTRLLQLDDMALGTSTLTEQDVERLQELEGVRAVAPFGVITGTVTTLNGNQYSKGSIVATTELAPTLLNRSLKAGAFFEAADLNRNAVVLGAAAAHDLFGDSNPVGRNIRIRGNEFTIRGVLREFETAPVNVGINYNNAVFIPLGTAKQIGSGIVEIHEIALRVTDEKQLGSIVPTVRSVLLASHNGVEDFSVLRRDEYLALTDNTFDLLTTLVAAVASISLIVGGIGIMNIMLVSVTERTREIGTRKAVGATNRQILGQFLVEAVVLSVVGGFFGILASLVLNFAINLLTDLQPAISLPIMGLAMLMATVVGIIFGVMPALKAAYKDPIAALRHV